MEEEPSQDKTGADEPSQAELSQTEPSQADQLQKLAAYFEDLTRYRMPFGRYGPDNFPPAGKLIYELPHEYRNWFKEKGGGFPKGKLGELMEFVYEVKAAGAEEIFGALR